MSKKLDVSSDLGLVSETNSSAAGFVALVAGTAQEGTNPRPNLDPPMWSRVLHEGLRYLNSAVPSRHIVNSLRDYFGTPLQELLIIAV
jgi:hypothetical protein